MPILALILTIAVSSCASAGRTADAAARPGTGMAPTNYVQAAGVSDSDWMNRQVDGEISASIMDGPQIAVADMPSPALLPGEDTLIAHLAPAEWVRMLSSSSGAVLPTGRIRRVACVGLEISRMLCGWEQRSGIRWRRRSRYTDLARPTTGPSGSSANRILGHGCQRCREDLTRRTRESAGLRQGATA